jgi:hypothetical protein
MQNDKLGLRRMAEKIVFRVVVIIYNSNTAGLDKGILYEEAPIFKSCEWHKDSKGNPTTLKKNVRRWLENC